MNRFVGLSLMCLMFWSAQAKSEQGESEFSGSSWSIQMSQNNGEPIKVKSERKEYDKTGVTLHRRSQGIIENGVYKPISEQDFDNLSWKEDQDIDALLKIGDQYEDRTNEKKDFRKNKRKFHPRGFFKFKGKKDMPEVKHHPRRYGYHPIKFDEKLRRRPQDFARKEQQRPMPTNQTVDNMENRLKNRSRVSFYRPVERMFEKLFGIKKQNDEKRSNFEENSSMYRPTKPHFVKKKDRRHPRRGGWFRNYDSQNQAETEGFWRNMPEFEDEFFDDEYYDVEE